MKAELQRTLGDMPAPVKEVATQEARGVLDDTLGGDVADSYGDPQFAEQCAALLAGGDEAQTRTIEKLRDCHREPECGNYVECYAKAMGE